MQVFKRLTLGLGSLCLLLVAGAVSAPHLFFMAGLLLSLAGVSCALGWFTLRGLVFSREIPTMAWEGDESELVYTVSNSSRIMRFFLMVREPFPEWVEPLQTDPTLFNVAGQSVTRTAVPVRFLKRGVYNVSYFDVTALDPLGVFAFTRRVPCNGEIVVYPMPQNMGQMPLVGRDRNGWQEFSATALRGNSVDPDGVRAYVPGDPLRRIHWRQTARTGVLSVIEFEEAQAVNVVIALDLQAGSLAGRGLHTTLEYAVRLAATIAKQATDQGAGVRLLLPPIEANPELHAIMAVAGKGPDHLYRILDALARVEADASAQLSDVITESVDRLPSGTTLIAITSLIQASLVPALSRFTVNGADVALVYVDPTTFISHRSSPSNTEVKTILNDIAGANVQIFEVRCNASGDVMPEVAHV